ncbi:MAG: hypothetical protein M3Y22_02970, partial [Pseudomonadota bacterium]|nr:hypothetical protein [Pseudomonadota bacterium]
MTIAFAASLVGDLHSASANANLPAYFNPGDAAPYQPLVFMRQAPPPKNNKQTKRTYAYGPITDSSAQDITDQNNSTWTGGKEWPFLWVSRARVPRGDTLESANPIYPPIFQRPGFEYRTEFTTVARADAVTKAQVLYVMGATATHWQAPLIAVGLSASDAISWDQLNHNPAAYFTSVSQDGASKVMVDKMAIPTTVSTSAYGIVLDYEVQDDRTVSEAVNFLVDMGSTIRSYRLKAYLFTNPWDGQQVTNNGFALSSMDPLKANFDFISLFLLDYNLICNVQTAYAPSVTFLRGVSGKLNFNQILVTVDESLCSPADAAAIHNQRSIDNFAGYRLFADGANEGGSTLTGVN